MCLFTGGVLCAEEDITVADFEGATYAPWTVMGEAFGPGSAQGTLRGQMLVEGFNGRGLVNSFFKGDDTTGRLTSPEFRIERKFVAFLIGGGRQEEKLALQLLVDGKVVRSATGRGFYPKTQELSVAGHRAPAPWQGGRQRLAVLCDRTGVEVFASDGLCYMPLTFDTKPENQRLHFETRGGAAKVTSLQVHELRSAWHR